MSLLNEAEWAPEASEADWDEHKETIRRLYCIEDMDLNGVQAEMKRRHQFNASAYQYEKYLKRWKFRKNLKKEEWIPIKQKILARKRRGKDSDIYLEGVLMPAKKVKRGIGRYQKADYQINFVTHDYSSIPQTPDGVTIATPKPIEGILSIFENLPISHYFSALFNQAGPQVTNANNLASAFRRFANVSVSFKAMPTVITPSPQAHVERTNDCTTSATGSWIPDLIMENHESLSRGSELFHMSPEHTGALRALQIMFFAISNGYLDPEDSIMVDSIAKWLQQEDNGPLLRQLLSISGPTAESILKALYPYALLSQKTSIIKIFLELGCSPNINFNHGPPSFWRLSVSTALGLACEQKNLDLVRVLLTAGADSNQLSCTLGYGHIDTHAYEGQCPIVLSIWGHAYSRSGTLEENSEKSILPFIETLIQAGACVDGASPLRRRPLVEAGRWGNEPLICLLLAAGADVNLCDGEGRLPLAMAIEYNEFGCPAETERSLSVIRLLLIAGADINTPFRHLPNRDEAFDEQRDADIILPFDMAAAKGSLELVQFLYYSTGARPSRFALTYAIAKGNVDVVKFMLEVGAAETDMPAPRSSLVQAIRSQEAEMFRLVFLSGVDQQNIETLSLAVKTAIDKKRYDIVPELLVAGECYESLTEKWQPALMSAASSGNVDILGLLLRKGAYISSNILVQAFESNHEPMIKKVLELGALWDFNKMDRIGNQNREHVEHTRETCKTCFEDAHRTFPTPLIAAVRFGNCDIVKRMLEQGAQLTSAEALVCAIRCENLEMVTTLLEAGSPINASACDHRSDITPLQAAVLTGQLSFVRIILNNGVNPDLSSNIPFSSSSGALYVESADGKPPLQAAIYRGDYEIAKMLLQAGADINHPHAEAQGYSALTLAIRSGNQQMIDLVIAQGANPLDSNALKEAVKQDNVPLTNDLLTSSSRAGKKFRGSFGCEALCEAIRRNSMNLVKLLLSNGIHPNQQPPRFTALGFAITHCKEVPLEIVETLLQAGADPNGLIRPSAHSGGKSTALVAAVRTGVVPLVALLIQYGADPNALPKGVVWRSPLQAACEAGKLKVVQLLLDHGVDVNAPPAWHSGGTALQFAAINGHLGIVSTLLDRGADMNAPAARVYGRTALEGAAENGRLDTVRALLNAGVGIHGPYEGQYKRA